jgi:hypothetical protein
MTWQRRTIVWHEVTRPAQGPERQKKRRGRIGRQLQFRGRQLFDSREGLAAVVALRFAKNEGNRTGNLWRTYGPKLLDPE